MSTTVKWNTFTDTLVDSFKIYRAVTGVVVSFPNSLVTGDKLVFAATSPTRQVVVLTGTNISQVAADVNAQAKGLKATIDGTNLILRCTARTNPKLKLEACTFLTHTGVTPQLIGPAQNFVYLDSVTFDSEINQYEYTDPVGDPVDYYRITTLMGSTESGPSQSTQSIIDAGNICMIEGRVINSQNDPVLGAEVSASVVVPVGSEEDSGIVPEVHTVYTDELGRWSIPFIRSQLILFQIPALGYNQVIQVPDAPSALFRGLKPVNDNEFDGVDGVI